MITVTGRMQKMAEDLSEHQKTRLLTVSRTSSFGRVGFNHRFRDAVLIEATDGPTAFDGGFDVVVLETADVPPDLLAAAVAALRPDGDLVVMIDLTPSSARLTELAMLDMTGLSWKRVEVLGDQLCLRLGHRSGEQYTLSAMAEGLWTAYDHGLSQSKARVEQLHATLTEAAAAYAEQQQAWSNERKKLLRRIEQVEKRRREERRQTQGLRLVRTVLKRHRPGRVLLRLVAPAVSISLAAVRKRRARAARGKEQLAGQG